LKENEVLGESNLKVILPLHVLPLLQPCRDFGATRNRPKKKGKEGNGHFHFFYIPLHHIMSSISLRRSAGSSNSLSNFQPVLSAAQLKLREAEREAARRGAAEAFSSCVESDQRLLASALDEVDENIAQYLRWRKILLLSLQTEERLQGHGVSLISEQILSTFLPLSFLPLIIPHRFSFTKGIWRSKIQKLLFMEGSSD
jgi:hypothetical protein